MCNITSYTSKKLKRAQQSFIQTGDTENSDLIFDIYAQNFYLYAFTKID